MIHRFVEDLTDEFNFFLLWKNASKYGKFVPCWCWTAALVPPCWSCRCLAVVHRRTEWPRRETAPEAKPPHACTHTLPYDSRPTTALQDTHHLHTDKQRELVQRHCFADGSCVWVWCVCSPPHQTGLIHILPLLDKTHVFFHGLFLFHPLQFAPFFHQTTSQTRLLILQPRLYGCRPLSCFCRPSDPRKLRLSVPSRKLPLFLSVDGVADAKHRGLLYSSTQAVHREHLLQLRQGTLGSVVSQQILKPKSSQKLQRLFWSRILTLMTASWAWERERETRGKREREEREERERRAEGGEERGERRRERGEERERRRRRRREREREKETFKLHLWSTDSKEIILKNC